MVAATLAIAPSTRQLHHQGWSGVRRLTRKSMARDRMAEGRCSRADDTGAVERRANDAARAIYREAEAATSSPTYSGW